MQNSPEQQKIQNKKTKLNHYCQKKKKQELIGSGVLDFPIKGVALDGGEEIDIIAGRDRGWWVDCRIIVENYTISRKTFEKAIHKIPSTIYQLFTEVSPTMFRRIIMSFPHY